MDEEKPNPLANNRWRKGDFNERCRAKYFAIRDERRNTEIDELINDTEFLIGELHRMERRAGVYNLVGLNLRNYYVRLYYWRRKQEEDDISDQRLINLLAEHFYLQPLRIRNIIFNSDCFDDWWLLQVEGGHEQDYYIPENIRLEFPVELEISQKSLKRTRKRTLQKQVIDLTRKNERLEKKLNQCTTKLNNIIAAKEK